MRAPARAAALACALAAHAVAQPDIHIADLPDIAHQGPVAGVHGYSVGFTVCNTGDTFATWESNTPNHPVQGWGIYRLEGGRFEQISVSWLKHGNFAASSPGCGSCVFTDNGRRLGAGCRDTYDASFNAGQAGLGPRFQVNAANGAFPMPWASPNGPTGNAIYKMAQVAQSDLRAGARYLVEGIIIHPQDAANARDDDNASYRLATLNTANFALAPTGTTRARKPAILAWHDDGLGADTPDPGVTIHPVDIQSDGRVYAGVKCWQLPDGWWRYEYAVENVNSHRSVAGIRFRVRAGGLVRALYFHDVPYHSGEPFDGSDWIATRSLGYLAFRAPQSFAQNETANAIRWGTTYSFSFESTLAPEMSLIPLELFRPPAAGEPDVVSANILGPQIDVCSGDIAGVVEGAPDGAVGIDDLLWYLKLFERGDIAGDYDNGSGTRTPDDAVDIADLLYFLRLYEQGC